MFLKAVGAHHTLGARIKRSSPISVGAYLEFGFKNSFTVLMVYNDINPWSFLPFPKTMKLVSILLFSINLSSLIGNVFSRIFEN